MEKLSNPCCPRPKAISGVLMAVKRAMIFAYDVNENQDDDDGDSHGHLHHE